MEQHTMKVIARIRSDFPEKFGIPRQSGLVPELRSKIVFEPEFRNADALRGIEGFSHLWLIWQFSAAVRDTWSPTVRPPRLGGNRRMGVFATRSPFRPNAIGLSSLKLEKIEYTAESGPVLHVTGADMLDMTPIYDIKPYLTFCDSHPDAVSGFAAEYEDYRLKVHIPDDISGEIDPDILKGITNVLALDPRPSYQNDPERIYKMDVAGYFIEFFVQGNTAFVKTLEKRK